MISELRKSIGTGQQDEEKIAVGSHIAEPLPGPRLGVPNPGFDPTDWERADRNLYEWILRQTRPKPAKPHKELPPEHHFELALARLKDMHSAHAQRLRDSLITLEKTGRASRKHKLTLEAELHIIAELEKPNSQQALEGKKTGLAGPMYQPLRRFSYRIVNPKIPEPHWSNANSNIYNRSRFQQLKVAAQQLQQDSASASLEGAQSFAH